MSRHRLLIVLAPTLALMWTQALYGQKIRFAQITDVHILDSEKDSEDKPRDSRPENERGLRWAVDEINRRNAIGPAYDFVVFTGDIGLEQVLKPKLEPLLGRCGNDLDKFGKELNASLDRALDPDLNEAVRRFREFLDRSDVRLWIMVPGNNDLYDEIPATSRYYHIFVEKLWKAVADSKTILDLTPVNKARAKFVRGNCQFFGFDNASFKWGSKAYKNNSYDHKLREDNGKLIQEAQKCLLNRLKEDITEATPKKGGSRSYAYIFCHIPWVDDAKSREDVKNDLFAAYLSDKHKAKEIIDKNTRYSLSAWGTEADRATWERIVECPHVRGVFAGHFHSSDRRIYRDPRKSLSNSAYPKETFAKLTICPPLAVKFQMDDGEGARGFRDVRINGEDGTVSSEIVWLPSGP